MSNEGKKNKEGSLKNFFISLVAPPAILDDDFEKHLFDILKKQVEKKCTRDDGYISELTEITHVGDIHITPANTEAVVDVHYKARVITPIIGEVTQGTVTKNSQFGIFVTINQMMQVLIPISKMRKIGNVNYSQQNTTFTISTEDETIEISEGDFVDVCIDDFSFEHNRFACIGSLVL